MKTKERLDMPIRFGTPSHNLYDSGQPLGWDPNRIGDFPLSYRIYGPVDTRPSLGDYYAKALGCKLQNAISYPKWAGYSRIEYDTSISRSKFNYCYHEKTDLYLLPLSYKLESSYSANYIYVEPILRFWVSGSPRDILSFGGDTERRNRSSRAWWTMQPRFEGTFNAMNFLFEASEFKSLLNKFVKLINVNWVKLTHYRNALQKVSKQEGSLSVANAWLSLKLEIEPLLQDLSNIVDSLCASVEAIQSKFAIDGQSGTTVHYTEPVASVDRTVSQTGNLADVLFTGSKSNTTFTATMCMKYDYDMRSPMEAVKKFWGLEGSFSTIWEITRLSFVVDYFVKIGKAIHAMELDQNVSNVRAIKYCESYKGSNSIGTYAQSGLSPYLKDIMISGAPFQGKRIISGYEASYYLREPGSVYKGLYIPIIKTPSTTQGVTMVALIRSMLG